MPVFRMPIDWSKIAPLVSQIASDPGRYINLSTSAPGWTITVELSLTKEEYESFFVGIQPDQFEGEIVGDSHSLPSGSPRLQPGGQR